MSPSRRPGNARRWCTARKHEWARDAKPRTAPMARRRDGDIAPYRKGARGGRTMPSRAPRRGAAARWGHRALPPSRTSGARRGATSGAPSEQWCARDGGGGEGARVVRAADGAGARVVCIGVVFYGSISKSIRFPMSGWKLWRQSGCFDQSPPSFI